MSFTSPYDLAYLVPQVQRAIEGVVQSNWQLTSGEVYDIVADACAQIVLYCGDLFGNALVVTATDPTTNAPTGFGTISQLSPDQGAVIAAEAALDYFYHRFAGQKMSERISDEASNWEYALSPALLIAQLKLLQDKRDKALEAVSAHNGGLEGYVSFLAVRDQTVARYIEPWVYGGSDSYGLGAGGLESDFGYGALPTGSYIGN